MEISAIMNIHELAMSREAKQKIGSQGKKVSEDTKNRPLEAGQTLTDPNKISQTDEEDKVKEGTSFTGNFVNIVT